MLSKLQYISQGNDHDTQLKNITAALEGGCNWVQLRFKTATALHVFNLAEVIAPLCKSYDATFIINDHAEIARAVNADGVHLGLNDMSVNNARQILASEQIIGGTANSLLDVSQRIKEQCNYIGLGPFRFTTTKEKLSPVLGIDGYRRILTNMRLQEMHIPIYAIGGILPDDVEEIMSTGMYGIAISGSITQATNKKETIRQLKESIYAKDINHSRY